MDSTAKNVWGFIAIILCVVLLLNKQIILGIIAGVIGFYIRFSKSDSSTAPCANKRIKGKNLHCTVSNTFGSFSSVLNNLEQIVDCVLRHCVGHEIEVLIIIQKENAINCSIDFQIENIRYQDYNITFGNEFQVYNETARFNTKNATGFTTPERIKQELLLQFNWPDILVNINELSVLEHGDFKNTPMIVFRFTAKFVQQ